MVPHGQQSEDKFFLRISSKFIFRYSEKHNYSYLLLLLLLLSLSINFVIFIFLCYIYITISSISPNKPLSESMTNGFRKKKLQTFFFLVLFYIEFFANDLVVNRDHTLTILWVLNQSVIYTHICHSKHNGNCFVFDERLKLICKTYLKCGKKRSNCKLHVLWIVEVITMFHINCVQKFIITYLWWFYLTFQ